MRITPQRIFYDKYEWAKVSFTTFMRRVKIGIPMEEAIFKKIEKSYWNRRKPGSGRTKWSGVSISYRPELSEEEKTKTDEIEKYRKSIETIREESEKAQIRNRIVGDLDIYYAI